MNTRITSRIGHGLTLWLLSLLLLLACSPRESFSQEDGELATRESKTISTIRALRTSITSVEESLAAARKELSTAVDDSLKEELTLKIAGLNETLERLRSEMKQIITGIDLKRFENPEEEDLDLSREFKEFMRPIVIELKDVTSKPRELEDLRSRVSYLEGKLELASDAVNHIKGLLEEASEQEIIDDFSARLAQWEGQKAQIESNLNVARYRLEDAEENSSGVFGSLADSITEFATTRGWNLFLAILIGLGVFLLLRLVHRLIHRLAPFRKRGKRSFGVRIIDVAYYVFNLFATLISSLITLYVLGDWIMLGLFILVIIGIGWTGKTALPLVYEQAKLMLNLGAVREGERLIYNGIPWEVQSINIYSDLVNHELDSGQIRLPLKALVELHSRPFRSTELFFPSKKGDWILMDDGQHGKVVAQTPDWVQVIQLGGSRTTFKSSDFVSMQPHNLSTNFRVKESFGVDYQHQADSTTLIPETLKQVIMRELEKVVDRSQLINLSVEFEKAGASSLDYAILADFEGQAAPAYRRLHRAIQRACVQACNENGWVIPFTQITLHNAA